MTAPLHLYVHWPWCQQKCPYCDFNSHTQRADDQRAAYFQHIEDEVTWWTDNLQPNRPISSVYFGGGTPSLMRPHEVERLLQSLKHLGVWQPTTEVTLECNPASIIENQPADFFTSMKSVGVNRVSVGIQGLREDWLAFLGRKHTVKDALATLDNAMTAGLRCNADVIYGLPEQQLDAWLHQLQTLAGMGLEHLSAYQLTIEPNTAFWGQVRRGDWLPLDGDGEAEFFEATRHTLAGFGYENYEISNFAKPGGACRHNLGVWRGEDYLGLGAGAHGAVHLADASFVRTATRKHPDHYLAAAPKKGQTTHFAQWVQPNSSQQVQDAVFAGLRLKEGVDIGKLAKSHGTEVLERALDMQSLALFEAQNWLQRTESGYTGHLQLTESGWPLLSGMLRDLFRSIPS